MFAIHLNDIRIRHKLLLLLLFPVVVLMFFAGYGILEKWRQHGEAESVRLSYQYVLKLSNVVHELQKERGLSAGYIGSSGTTFLSELEQQRGTTDEAINQLRRTDVYRFFTSVPFVELRKDVLELEANLDDLSASRRSVDQLAADTFFASYSEINSDIIDLILQIGNKTNDETLVRLNHAYGILIRIQEYAGQERGYVNGVLASGRIKSETIAQVSNYVAKQESLQDELMQLAQLLDWNIHLNTVAEEPAVVAVQKTRKALFTRAEKLDVINDLLAVIGYGGLIHQFKNFVIRGGEPSQFNISALYQSASESLARYRVIPYTSDREIQALDEIQQTLDRYIALIETADAMHRDRALISQIDSVVKVDDTLALNGIRYLRQGIPEIGADDWFHNATQRIDLFKTLSTELKEISLHYIEKKTQETFLLLSSHIFFTVMALLTSLFLGVTITRRLVTGATAITAALDRVEETGDFSGHIKVDGDDEIAAMGHAFNNLIKGRQMAENRLWLASKVFDSTIDGIMITDPTERIVSINPAFTTITGYSEKDMVGKTPRMLSSNRHNQAFFQKIWQEIQENGCWQGEIWNRRKSGEIYPQWQNISEVRDDQNRLLNYISVFSDISIIKHSQEQMEYLAHHDPLTGLPNRTLLDQHLVQGLERARRQHHMMAILFLDLDRFKNVNDLLGHPAGDELLKQVSNSLRGLIRAEDLVARLGGDEFALILEAPADSQSVARVAQKCIDACLQPFVVGESDVHTSASIGISIFPDDGERVDVLLKHADTAMYHAKDQGRNNYCFYNKRMTELAIKRLALENQLRQALERDEFVLQYQPQVSLATGEITGVEALIRWQQPDGSLIFPTEFISVAEESGLIDKIDRWVLTEACQQAKRWQLAGFPQISIAVNISGFSIEHGLLLDMVEGALTNSQLDPRVLELEITEGYLMQHREQASLIIEQLRDQGVTFAIDDFGTGYSSLSYLKTLPINRLKIDRSFIRDIPDDESDKAITMAVIALGHSMQMQVVAEGVESINQAHFLSGLGCDFAQGYMYSQSVSAEMIEGLLSK